MSIQHLAEDRVFSGVGTVRLPPPAGRTRAEARRPSATSRTSPLGQFAFADGSQVVSFGSFVLCPAQQLLLEGDRTIRLGSRAVSILVALVERAGQIVSKEDLVGAAWPGLHVDDSNLRVHVAALRRALGDERYIKTVPLRGYSFVARVLRGEATATGLNSVVTSFPAPRAATLGVAAAGQDELAKSLSRQLADHASLLNGLVTSDGGANVTPREAALLSLQILALDAALTEVLGPRG